MLVTPLKRGGSNKAAVSRITGGNGMSNPVHRVAALAIALALAFPMLACDTATETRAGHLSIYLTDAPGDEVVEAWVTITDIYLQGAGGAEDPPTGRVYLLEGAEETHELLSLANTVAELVADAEVPAGVYGQLRLVISGGCLVTADARVYASSPGYDLCGSRDGTLMMPSFAQSGLKVALHGLRVDGGDHAVLLDFDVSESFGRAAGQSGMWVMTPVVHAALLEDAAGVTATLGAGDVTLPAGYALDQFSATLSPAEGDTSRVAFRAVGGEYRAAFRFLIPEQAPFEVRLNAPEGLTVTVSPASPQSVAPAKGETARVEWVLQSAVTGG
jgi:hypothetical protein